MKRSRLVIALCSILTFVSFGIKAQEPIFPLLGKKAKEKGAVLPRPFGLSANYFYQNMNIGITGLELSAPQSEPVRFTEEDLTVERSEATVHSFTVRPDLWLFPFLNVYGIAGKTWTNTDVFVTYSPSAPPISTKADPEGNVYGFGAMLAMKFGPVWMTADQNLAWSDLDILDEPARAINLYLRIGHKFPIGKSQRTTLNLWVGASKQDFDTRNSGSYSVNSITPSNVQGVELSAQQRMFAAWNILGRIHYGQEAMDQAIPPGMSPQLPAGSVEYQQLMTMYPEPLNEDITYGLEKTLDEPWNMLVGLQVEIDRRYSLRMEGGIVGDRKSFMTSLGYRFGK